MSLAQDWSLNSSFIIDEIIDVQELGLPNPQHENWFQSFNEFPHQNLQRKKRLKKFSNSLIKENPKFIADNLYAIQLVQELTNAGIFKISNSINVHYQTQLDQIIKYDKQLQTSIQDQAQLKQPFFINMSPIQICFQYEQIIFKQAYTTLEIDLNLNKKYQYLLEVINLTMRLLDQGFIKDFKSIIYHYINLKEKKYSNAKIIEFLYNEIEKNPEQYSYISKWQEIKSKYKPIQVIYKQIKILEKKDELNRRTSLKVISKHIKKVDKLQKRLYQEQLLSPLEFLLQNLFEIFNSILKFYDENYENNILPQPQNMIKNNEINNLKQQQSLISKVSVQECGQSQKIQIKQQEQHVQQFDCQKDVSSSKEQLAKITVHEFQKSG